MLRCVPREAVVPAHTKKINFNQSESIINRIRREQPTVVWQCRQNTTRTPRRETEMNSKEQARSARNWYTSRGEEETGNKDKKYCDKTGGTWRLFIYQCI
jgi:hypothetical protein